MARSNPGVGPLKPHIRKVAGGRWHVFYRDRRGSVYSAIDVAWITRNTISAGRARAWVKAHNG